VSESLAPDDVVGLRPKLLAVAYRMLGTVADAEDAVQDAYLRYHRFTAGQRGGDVESPEGWLVRTTTRLCIDRLRAAKREEYVGPWLPEPVSDGWPGARADRAELADSLSTAFLLLLETLSPAERATYVLREVFGYEFDEIAGLLDTTPVNARQIASRARKRLEVRERRFAPPPGAAEELAARFFAACQSGDVGAIESMLAADVVLISDGGGKAFAAKKPVAGVRKVANLLAVVFRKLRAVGEVALATVNGGPGVVFTVAGRPVEVMTLAADGGRVSGLFVVLNPDKLCHWPAAGGGGSDRPGPWERKNDGTATELPEAGPGAA
jgi:RNA polymerase sigma-70 factor (ECF subfamily)